MKTILVTILLFTIVYSQDSTIVLDNNTFVYENNEWFVLGIGNSKNKIARQSFTVKLKENIPIIAFENYCRGRGIEILRINKLGFIDLKLPNTSCFHTIYNNFRNIGLFEYITINSYVNVLLSIPDDPGFGDQEYLYEGLDRPNINALEAWEIETGSTNPVIVAVIDLGVDFDNQDLIYNELGWDFTGQGDPNPDPEQDDHHGTSMAGIIAAKTNNELAVSGIAGGWTDEDPGTSIMALRVANEEGFDISLVDDAIIYAADNGAKIINMSFGGGVDYYPVSVAIGYAYSKGCFLVASTGNDYNSVEFPASHSLVLAVSGIKNNWDEFSTVDEGIDVTAPAQNIYSLLNNQSGGSNANYGLAGSGTSASCAMVSGVASLLLSKNPNLIPMDLRNVINQTAVYETEMENNSLKFGNGLVKADRALLALTNGNGIIPDYPLNLSVSGSSGTNPVFTWQTVQPASREEEFIDHYNVYRSIAPSKYHFTKVAEVQHNYLLNNHSWTDNSVTIPSGGAPYYYYRVTSSKDDRESITSNEVSVNANVGWKIASEAKDNFDYKLEQNYPNPFNPSTTINYSIKEDGNVKLTIFNILGEEITALVNKYKNAGNYSIDFNVSNLPSGLYFYKIDSGNYSKVMKMILLK